MGDSNLSVNDVHTPFSEACGSRDSFRRRLQLATYCQDRSFKPEKVFRRLRFLSVPTHDSLLATVPPTAAKTCITCAKYPLFDAGLSTNDDDRSEQMYTLRLTNPGDLAGCNHYVAVSYCWQQPRALPGDRSFSISYAILDGNRMRMSRAPPNVIQRAIDFAISNGYRLIWIDQDCIDQDDLTDRSLHIQSMHLIYRQACDVVAVLNIAPLDQTQIAILEGIRKGSDMAHFESLPFWEQEEQSRDIVEEALQLTESIANDPWYTRAWTYQEALLAARAIYLLIPCRSGLRAGSMQIAADSQLIIRDVNLIQALGSYKTNELLPDTDILRDSVPEWKYHHVDVALESHRLSALDAIGVLLRRRITDGFDLVAICGNLCNYGIRLDVQKVRKSGIGLSVAFFALALLNGDLSLMLALNHNTLCSVTDQTRALPLASVHDVATTYRKAELIDWIDESAFSCRVRPPTLLSDGLLIRGILWRVEHVDLSTIRQRYIQHEASILRDECPRAIVREIFNATHQVLSNANLAVLIEAVYKKTGRGSNMLELLFVSQLMVHPFLTVAVSDDPAVPECRLLPATAHEYGHFGATAEDEHEERAPLFGLDKITYLFTPYRVLLEAESKKEIPQFLLVWWIHSVQTTQITTHLYSQGWPRKMKADTRLFSGDPRNLVTRYSSSEKVYHLHCF